MIWLRLAVCALVSSAMLSCGSDGSISDQFVSKLRRCDLVGPGEVNAYDETFETDEDRCFARCLVSGSCEEIDDYLCSRDITLETRCAARCFAQPEQVSCGDGTTILEDQVCDGVAQCADASDEASCATFDCFDESTILATRVCDYRWDCSEGEDEVRCPGFQCADRRAAPFGVECDGRRDCRDGSDEASCPLFFCEDGRTILESYRCDFVEQCFDGSDEEGCAESQLSCR